MLQALAEGVLYSAIDLDTYKTGERDTTPLTEALIRVETPAPDLVAAVARGRILGEATNFARLMANEPGNVLTPRVFVERGAALAAGTSLDVQIHDERAIEALGMGLIEGVARGSIEPARLLTLSHTPPGVTGGPVLGLVGKGVTFDTGGISIKPADMHGPDEGRHGRRRRGDRRDARAQPARGADPRRRRRAGGREHAGRQGAQARAT